MLVIFGSVDTAGAAAAVDSHRRASDSDGDDCAGNVVGFCRRGRCRRARCLLDTTFFEDDEEAARRRLRVLLLQQRIGLDVQDTGMVCEKENWIEDWMLWVDLEELWG